MSTVGSFLLPAICCIPSKRTAGQSPERKLGGKAAVDEMSHCHILLIKKISKHIWTPHLFFLTYLKRHHQTNTVFPVGKLNHNNQTMTPK